jgi:hypothetical protein
LLSELFEDKDQGGILSSRKDIETGVNFSTQADRNARGKKESW